MPLVELDERDLPLANLMIFGIDLREIRDSVSRQIARSVSRAIRTMTDTICFRARDTMVLAIVLQAMLAIDADVDTPEGYLDQIRQRLGPFPGLSAIRDGDDVHILRSRDGGGDDVLARIDLGTPTP